MRSAQCSNQCRVWFSVLLVGKMSVFLRPLIKSGLSATGPGGARIRSMNKWPLSMVGRGVVNDGNAGAIGCAAQKAARVDEAAGG